MTIKENVKLMWQNLPHDEVKTQRIGTSLAVQRLRLCASTAGGAGSIPGRVTKIPHPACHVMQPQKKQNKTKTTPQRIYSKHTFNLFE